MNDIELLQEHIEKITGFYVTEVDGLLTKAMINVAEEFHKKYPNHRIRFMDGMGTYFWILNDEILDTESLIDERKLACVQPLLDALEAYEEIVWINQPKMFSVNHDIRVGYTDDNKHNERNYE